MTPADLLRALAKRVCDEPPSRELDAEVALAVGWVCETPEWWWPPHIVALARSRKRGKWKMGAQPKPMPPTYTRSRDADLMLRRMGGLCIWSQPCLPCPRGGARCGASETCSSRRAMPPPRPKPAPPPPCWRARLRWR